MATEFYHRSRAPAEEYARQYEQLKERAEKARGQGLRRLEENLCNQAEKMYRLMRDEHDKAAATIFQENNSRRAYHEIDLHDLHVNEAETKLIQFLRSRRSYRGTISIITGQGNNSRGGVCFIQSRVIRFLETNKYSFHIPSHNRGRIEVTMEGPKWG